MPDAAEWGLPGVPVPHVDEDGPWWEEPAIPHWWVRERDGVCEARHKHGYLADVTARNSYLLAVFTLQAQMQYVAQRREQRDTSAA